MVYAYKEETAAGEKGADAEGLNKDAVVAAASNPMAKDLKKSDDDDDGDVD